LRLAQLCSLRFFDLLYSSALLEARQGEAHEKKTRKTNNTINTKTY
jgi:hypothetical protein